MLSLNGGRSAPTQDSLSAYFADEHEEQAYILYYLIQTWDHFFASQWGKPMPLSHSLIAWDMNKYVLRQISDINDFIQENKTDQFSAIRYLKVAFTLHLAKSFKNYHPIKIEELTSSTVKQDFLNVSASDNLYQAFSLDLVDHPISSILLMAYQGRNDYRGAYKRFLDDLSNGEYDDKQDSVEAYISDYIDAEHAPYLLADMAKRIPGGHIRNSLYYLINYNDGLLVDGSLTYDSGMGYYNEYYMNDLCYYKHGVAVMDMIGWIYDQCVGGTPITKKQRKKIDKSRFGE